MCGLTGYWKLGEQVKGGRDLLFKMNNQIVHRGPDGEGYWLNEDVGLGHRRLSIIDIDGGQQPMKTVDNRYTIVFNGEIYNYKELKKGLVNKGYVFITNSDTEVIPYIIEEFGIKEGLNKLRGMFALALYDSIKKTLLLARDYVGIKPLYYSFIPKGGMLFGSELKSLAASNLIANEVDKNSLIDFLITGHTFSPNTAWAKVKELSPGTYILVDDKLSVESGKYWNWEPKVKQKTEAEWLDLIEDKLLDSVKAHMVSDVPVSSFLSGGVDSSLIVGMVCRHLQPNLSTYNVGFEEKKYDESPYARMVAKHTKSDHHEIRLKANDGTPELFQKIITQYDQPFGDSSALPMYLISAEIAKYSKVVLSGDGGDEMFAGYNRYQRLIDIERIKKIPFNASLLNLTAGISSILSKEKSRQFKKLSGIVRLSPVEQILSQVTYFSTLELSKIFQPGFLNYLKKDYHSSLLNYIPETYDNTSQALISMEITGLLHADYLRKVDIASMAHSIEVRTPFLDKEIFNLAVQIPLTEKLKKRTQKYLLKKVAERYMPKEVIYREKQGFGIPFDKWAAKSSMQQFIKDTLHTQSKVSTIIKPNYLEKLIRDFTNDTQALGISRYQTYQRIFMLLSLELWLQKWNLSI